ncbi:MAG: hypothetical protein DRP46_08400 [Candidatus Zixiibacteriota bacterium]|nr:MAG: hypothetical protein DRP46_08400 [candidate division Zixibacteria bacterium]
MRKITCQNSKSRHSNCDEGTSNYNKEFCDRHILVFGEEMQNRLSSLNIGIVAVGGLGILTTELLMRLFPRKLTWIEFDHISKSNLNRFTGSTIHDAKKETPKSTLASRLVRKFNREQEFVSINGNFLELQNQEKFKECDYLFVTADSVAVRLAANQLCLAHGIPMLDLGTGASVGKTGLRSSGGQIIRIMPDSGFCLVCSELYNLSDAMAEFMDDEEYKRQQDLGYVRGADIPDPQVYALNMMTASWAVWILMRSVAGEDLNFDVLAIDALNFNTYIWTEKKRKPNNCPICGSNGIVFGGDKVDFLLKDIDKTKTRSDSKVYCNSKLSDKKERSNAKIRSKSNQGKK